MSKRTLPVRPGYRIAGMNDQAIAWVKVGIDVDKFIKGIPTTSENTQKKTRVI